MNQILAVENDQKNNKKKKKNTTADIKNVITVFCVITILFGIAITGQGVYAIVNSFKTDTSQEQVAEQNISIDSDTNTGKVIISGTVPEGVQSIKYKWNDDEEQTITKNGEQTINEEIDLPVGKYIFLHLLFVHHF